MANYLSNVGSTLVSSPRFDLDDSSSVETVVGQLLQEAEDLPSNARLEQIAWIKRQQKVLEKEGEELMRSGIASKETSQRIDCLIDDFRLTARKNAESLKMAESRRAKEIVERDEFKEQFVRRMKELYTPHDLKISSSTENFAAKTTDARDLRVEHARTIWTDFLEKVNPEQKKSCSQTINKSYLELKEAPKKHDRLGIDAVISRELIQEKIVEAQAKIEKNCPESQE